MRTKVTTLEQVQRDNEAMRSKGVLIDACLHSPQGARVSSGSRRASPSGTSDCSRALGAAHSDLVSHVPCVQLGDEHLRSSQQPSSLRGSTAARTPAQVTTMWRLVGVRLSLKKMAHDARHVICVRGVRGFWHDKDSWGVNGV